MTKKVTVSNTAIGQILRLSKTKAEFLVAKRGYKYTSKKTLKILLRKNPEMRIVDDEEVDIGEIPQYEIN